MTKEQMVPILLDTDIGSDIDDAVCLAYLLRQPRCELLGVTTVSGEPQRRAMMVDAVCRAAGRDDVPIYSGSEKAMLVPQLQTEAGHIDALTGFPYRKDFPPSAAVEFLRQTIRSRPGEITLLTIGQLTNIGLLFALDPEIPGMLKGLVSMAGVFTTKLAGLPYREWNVLLDPHAAEIVYRAPLKSHLSIGLDVTMRCQLSAEESRRRLRGGPLDVVAGMAEIFFNHCPVITFHDPLAGAVIFDPEICKYEDGRIDIELQSQRLMGMSHWDPNAEEKPHRIAIDVDPARFFNHYFSVVGE